MFDAELPRLMPSEGAMMSQCLGPNEQATGQNWHIRNLKMCPLCEIEFCLTCSHGCPSCGLGTTMERRAVPRQVMRKEVKVRRKR